MAYDNEQSGRVILDLETAPIEDAASYLEPVSAPSNYKDEAKIAAYIAEKQQETIDKAALDPDLCRIAAIGLLLEDDGGPQVFLARTVDEETAILTTLWPLLAQKILIGFNILAFDALVLLRRSLYLGVTSPRLQVDRFKHPQILDLMQELSFNGTLKFHGLDFYCKRFGLDVPCDATKGADMPRLVAAEDWPGVTAHVHADVLKTATLAVRMGHFRFVPEPAGVL